MSPTLTEPTWVQPGAELVGAGLYRIPLPLPQDGLRAVNVYAILGERSVTLIDGGWALSEAETALAAALAPLGCQLGDIDGFLVTHVHRDHYTQAVSLRRRFGMPVSLGEGEQVNLDAMMQAAGGTADVTPRSQLLRAGADRLVELLDLEPGPEIDMANWEMPDFLLTDRQLLTVGPRTLEVIATPGHTRGHVVFRDESAGLLFAGDHVLPHITPSLGFEAAATPGALSRYLESLRLLLRLPDTRLLPAHGPVAPSVHARVAQLLTHHDVRLAAALDQVQQGATTGYEVARALGWTRHDRAFDSLDLFNQSLAVTETTAHLEVLAARGDLVRTAVGRVDHYLPTGHPPTGHPPAGPLPAAPPTRPETSSTGTITPDPGRTIPRPPTTGVH